MSEVTLPSLRWRSAFAATLAMSMGIGPFAVNAISALSPSVVPDLGLSRTQLGSLATVTFAVAALTSVVGGRQVDVLGGRTVLRWVFIIGAAGAAAMAVAQSLAWLWVGAALGGLSQAVANPVTNQLIADHIPMGRQGLQIGIKQSGVQMAQAVIGFVLPPLAIVAGWRGSLLVGVALALIGVVLASAVLPRRPAAVVPAGKPLKTPLDPMVWWLAVYTCTIGITIQAVLLYVPLYAFQQVELSAPVAGMATGVLGVAGMVARIVWGRLAERQAAPIRMLAWLAGVALVSVLAILAGEHLGAWVLWPGLVGFGASAMAANAVVMLAVVRGAGKGRTGRASGVIGLGLYLGFMAGPVSFGALVDATDSYTAGWAAVAVVCAIALAITAVWVRR